MEFVEFLYSDAGQKIAAEAGLRPRTGDFAKALFKPIELKCVDEVFGGWDRAYEEHLGPEGSFSYAMKLRAALRGGIE